MQPSKAPFTRSSVTEVDFLGCTFEQDYIDTMGNVLWPLERQTDKTRSNWETHSAAWQSGTRHNETGRKCTQRNEMQKRQTNTSACFPFIKKSHIMEVPSVWSSVCSIFFLCCKCAIKLINLPLSLCTFCLFAIFQRKLDRLYTLKSLYRFLWLLTCAYKIVKSFLCFWRETC